MNLGSCLVFSCIFVTFQYGVLGQVCYLLVSIPDLCLPLFFGFGCLILVKTELALFINSHEQNQWNRVWWCRFSPASIQCLGTISPPAGSLFMFTGSTFLKESFFRLCISLSELWSCHIRLPFHSKDQMTPFLWRCYLTPLHFCPNMSKSWVTVSIVEYHGASWHLSYISIRALFDFL